MFSRARVKKLTAFFLLILSGVVFAEEAVDQEIIRNLDFFSQMDVIQNLELAKNLEAIKQMQADEDDDK
jgi:hypothetical protein